MIFKQDLSDRQLNHCKGVEGAVKIIMVDVLQHCLGKQVRQLHQQWAVTINTNYNFPTQIHHFFPPRLVIVRL